MIATTNTSLLSALELLIQEPLVTLSKDTIGKIKAAGIENAAITTKVKALLTDIVVNKKVDDKDALSRLATYAGLYIDDNETVQFKSDNASLDKLTFYIIFRLPYSAKGVEYEAPLPVSSSLPSSGIKKWGKHANYIRTIPGSGLKKLNQAGIDYDTLGDYYTTEAGYNSIGALDNSIDGSNSYKSLLFDHSNDYNKIPASFFMMSQDENPYVDFYIGREYKRFHHSTDLLNLRGTTDFYGGIRKQKICFYERKILINCRDTNELTSPATIDDLAHIQRNYIQISASGDYFIDSNQHYYEISFFDPDQDHSNFPWIL